MIKRVRTRNEITTPGAVLYIATLLLLLSFTAYPGTRNPNLQRSPPIVENVWIDVPLTQVFHDISMQTGVIIAATPKVPDHLVSLDAGNGKTIQKCLQQLIAARGLYIHKKNDRFFLITTADPSCPSFIEVAESKCLYLQYITAEHFIAELPSSFHRFVSTGKRPNEVLIYALPDITQQIMKIVHQVDMPPRQIVLEVLVIELWDESGEQFGLDWEYAGQHFGASLTEGLAEFTGIAKYTSVPKSSLDQLQLTLRALIRNKKAAIRSRPRVATLNGQQAKIDISLEEYFTIATDLYGATARLRTELEVIKSGVMLSITPHIGKDNDITVNVATEVSDVVARQNEVAGNQSGTLPLVKRRKVDTSVRVKAGDAIVIGGLIESRENSDEKKVPILSSIPLLGGLFRATETSTKTKEVVIFITPRLMNKSVDAAAANHKMISIEEQLEKLRSIVQTLQPDEPNNTSAKKKNTPSPVNGKHPIIDINPVIASLNEVADILEPNQPMKSCKNDFLNTPQNKYDEK